LWVLEKADTLFGEIAEALWLVVASTWRIPLVLLRRDSMSGIESKVASRRILPPRVNMLSAALASALFLPFVLSDRISHSNPYDAVSKLTSASAEAWIAVAAPALISLWLVIVLMAAVLRLVAGKGTRDPQPFLTQAISSAAIVCCIGATTILQADAWMSTIRRGLADEMALLGLVSAGLYLGYTGWNCARQISQGQSASAHRRWAMLFIGPVSFVVAAIGSLVGTYWLVQAQAAALEFMSRGAPPGWIVVRAPTCFVADEVLICQALMMTKSDLAVGAIKALDVSWRDLSRSGQFQPISLTGESPPPTVRTPRTELGTFWALRSKEPLPVALQIGKADACRLHDDLQSYRRRVPPLTDDRRPLLELSISVDWHRGYGLVPRDDAGLSYPRVSFVVEDESVEQDLEKLCAHSR
jgi:hypothetical protein